MRRSLALVAMFLVFPAPARAQDSAADDPGTIRKLFVTLARDIKQLSDKDRATILVNGGLLALAAYPFDEVATLGASSSPVLKASFSGFGSKAAIPAYAVAVYTSASRLQANSHYASDVIVGATLGLVAGRIAAFNVAQARVAVAPSAVPGGAGVIVSVLPRH